MKVFLFPLTLLFLFAQSGVVLAEDNSSEIFSRRVVPLLRAPNGSSCQECHFSGVELSDFLSDNEAQTFTRLRDSGWIDLDQPQKSKLLTFIHRHGKNTSPAIKKLREQERGALAAWISAASKNRALASAKSSGDIGIELDADLVRHLRTDRVLERFTENIWSEMGRCVNCHSPERNEKQVKEHGEQMSWIIPHDPESTLNHLRDEGLIDLEQPDQSEIRTKPTGLVDHGGGPKFPIGSLSDKRFLGFLRDYARIINDGYSSSDQLPKASAIRMHATENFLRLTNLPDLWADKLMRVDLFGAEDDGWSKHRIATAESWVNGEQSVWQGIMSTISSRDQHPPKKLTEGRYQAKLYVDQMDRMKADPDATFQESDFVGSLQFDGAWNLGWREPKIIDSRQIEIQ